MGSFVRRRVPLAVVAMSLVALGVILAPAAGAQDATPAEDEKVTFTIGIADDIRTLNPFKQVTGSEAWTLAMVYDDMIRYDQETLAPTPGMASSWEQSEDGLTWTFHLRDGLKWSDGEPLTAHDFEWFANFVIDNKIGQFIEDFRGTKSVTATDDQTVVWKTESPSFKPGLPAVYVLPEHIWGDFTEEEANQFKNLPTVGSYAFNVTEWEPDQFWKLEVNPNFWGPQPAIDELIFRSFKTDEAVVQALRRGTIDFAEYIPASLFESLQGAEGITTHVGGAGVFTNLNFNMYTGDKETTGHRSLLDVKVRQAINHAIDRQTLIDKVLRGYAKYGTTVMMPAFPEWHWEPTGEERVGFDLAEAERLLEEGGYEDTDGDGVREDPDSGEPLQFRLMTVANDNISAKASPYIKGWLNQIGIGVESDPVNNTTLLDRYYDLDFDMYIYGWSAAPDPDFLLSTFTTDQCLVWSDTCYSSKEYDDLYAQQVDETDPAKRKELVFQLQQHLYEQAPELVLWYDNDLEAYRSDRWTGFVQSPSTEGYLLDQYTMYSALTVKPVSGSTGTAAEAEGGLPAVTWVIAGLAIVALLVGASMLRRRREARD